LEFSLCLNGLDTSKTSLFPKRRKKQEKILKKKRRRKKKKNNSLLKSFLFE